MNPITTAKISTEFFMGYCLLICCFGIVKQTIRCDTWQIYDFFLVKNNSNTKKYISN